VKITLDQELVPFTVPNYVMAKSKPRPRQDGIIENPKYHLSELSDETLKALCDQFRIDVFTKARGG
jgi:hypothetical protein